MLSRQPREVERIDRNAMSAEPWPWIERLKPKRLRLRGLDDFPHVDIELVIEDLQLVDERDIDGAVRVLEDLARFSHFHTRHTNHFDNSVAVHRAGKLTALLVVPADDFRDRGRMEAWVTRILTLGAEGEEIVRAT